MAGAAPTVEGVTVMSDWDEFMEGWDWPAWADYLVFGLLAVGGLSFLAFVVWLVAISV
jgi:hypothetical protein